MKEKWQQILLGLLFLLPLSALAQHPDLQQANEWYRQESYEQARAGFEALIEEGYQSKALFYNLGNTYYRLGQPGKAILNYERALLLAPKDREIQENLDFVKEQLADEIIPLEVFPLIALWQNLQKSLSSGTWTAIGLLFFWAGTAGFLVWLLVPHRKQKVRGFTFGIIGLVLCVIPFFLASGRKAFQVKSDKAVIITEYAALYASPSERAELIYPLFEGATVRTIEPLEDWYKVNLANGYQGWVPAEKLALVRVEAK
jgi:tetratricopeptide (TPR) repeat protein